jgi:hypothetical protein
MKQRLLTQLLFAVILCFPLFAANTVPITGTTVGAPTAKFPLLGSTSGSCTLNATTEPYRLYTITTDVNATITVNITNIIDVGGSVDDTGLFWYQGAFSPAAGCTNFRKIGNDPTGANLTFPATAGTTYTLAVVGLFGSADDFGMSLTIPSGNITVTGSFNFAPPSVTNVTCRGGNNGQAVVAATGGSGAVTYTVNPSDGVTQSPAGTFTGLTARTYIYRHRCRE